MNQQTTLAALLLAAVAVLSAPAVAAEKIIPPPTEKDWLALSKLPDWSGVWTPDVTDQSNQVDTDPPPWNPAVAKDIDHMVAELKAGRPLPVLIGCLPYGMPAIMMIPHNAMEFLFTPGRITMLGESDGNRLRRIYTDGRGHPDDPDLTFMGHSIAHWEGHTLVVDTVGILPQVWLATDEAIGNPSNGDMHVVEHIHVEGEVMFDDMEVTAPNILTKPYKTTRKFYRQRSPKYEIVEGACTQGDFRPGKDAKGNAIYKPVVHGADLGLAPTGR